jgi:regulator of RNase E activity RraA
LDDQADLPPLELRAAATPEELRSRLRAISTATLSWQLRRRGLRDVVMRGLIPVGARNRFVGVARTLRYLPFREDLASEDGAGYNLQKQTVDELDEGEVLVIDARGDLSAGAIGDILVRRASAAGAAGIVTDGAVRDAGGIAALDIPVFARGRHPGVMSTRHLPWDRDVAIACGGVAVLPGDLVAADEDGVVVIPRGLIDDVLSDAEEQQSMEGFVEKKVAQGVRLEGLYPPGPAWRARWKEEAVDE